ncbi:MAG TPA: hypothetical protein VMT88_13895, partial [Actinomycetes bacterium]|nr:hypothetical protein [Actinomycetes bacterium]
LFGNIKPGLVGGGQVLTWREVADGSADAYLDDVASRIAELDKPVFLTVQHEPEDDVVETSGSGYTTSDFVDMYRHVEDRIEMQVAQRATVGSSGYPIWVWDVTGYPKWQSMWSQLYPGDEFVDWIAYDPYLQDPTDCDFGCVANRTYAGYPDWTGFYDWAEQNEPGKPLMLGEWGVREAPDGSSSSAKAELFSSTAQMLATEFPRLRALIYFNDAKSPQSPLSSRIETSDEALQAYRDMVADRYFDQSPVGSR